MRNGVSHCARSHDATRQRDAVPGGERSGKPRTPSVFRPVLRPVFQPVLRSVSSPCAFPVSSRRMPGQLRSRSRLIPLRGGTRSTPSSGRDSPGRASLFIRAVSILRHPYFGRSTVIDSQYNTLFKSRSIPAEGRASFRRLFRASPFPASGRAKTPRQRGRSPQRAVPTSLCTEKGSFPFPARLSRPPPAPSRGHARHRRSPRERFPCATGCSASRSVSSPGPFPHISISRAVSSLLAPASPISPHFASNATQPQTAGTAPGAARSRPPAGSSGPGPPVSLAPNHH